ncbi:MAG: M48 family metallopeptidase [Bacteroidales bacterium]|nr:M48 family metallopeptidase [Bacteroidales bacterium]
MYELIAKNKRKSVIVFLAMGLLLLILGGGLGLWFDMGSGYDTVIGPGTVIGMLIAIVLWAVQAWIAYKKGAQVVLSGMDAREITKSEDAMMYNIIEELSMASGLPMPKIYLINTPAMNAFAAGNKPENSVVAITAGLRNSLNRHEIQAVMAHEMSHIYNRDVMYMTFAGVMMCTIVLLSQILTRMVFYGRAGGRNRSSSNGSNGLVYLIFVIVVLVLAFLGGTIAQLFYFSLSRKREYLADTMAVKFTQDPSALADALQKISGDTEVFDPGKMAAAMCISKPKIKEHATNLYSTHPPIQKRIAILRAMSEGTSYENYCRAYQMVMGKDDMPKFKSQK